MNNDGGAAFPTTHETGQVEQGMSVREYIATHTDIPLATARALLEAQGMDPEQITIATLLEVRARLRVMEADALLRALDTKEPQEKQT